MFIDNREVEVSNIIKARCGEYTVYNGKIWKITAVDSVYRRLDREKSAETVWVKNNIALYKVLKPTGYISV